MNECIKTIIANIPEILEYFVPGYSTILFYRKIKDAKVSSLPESVFISEGVVISFFIKILLEGIFRIPHIGAVISSLLANAYVRCIIECIIGCVGAIIVIRLRQSPVVRKQFEKINDVALSETIFECCDMQKTPQVVVEYGEKAKAAGRLLSYDLDEGDAWLVLDYFKLTENGVTIDTLDDHRNYQRLLIPMSEVKCIIVEYDSKSRITPTDQTKLQKKAPKSDKKDKTK